MRNIPVLPTNKFTDINKFSNLFKVYDERKRLVGFYFKTNDGTIMRQLSRYYFYRLYA